MLVSYKHDRTLQVKFDPKDYQSIKTGELPLKTVATHILKDSPYSSFTKIVFNVTNREDLSYRLLEHIVHLLQVKVPCYVQYGNDIERRIMPNSIFTYTIQYDGDCLKNIDVEHQPAFILANVTDLPYNTELKNEIRY